MKATVSITLTPADIRALLKEISIEQCHEAMVILQQRISQEEDRKLVKKIRRSRIHKPLLDTPLDQLGFTPRMLSQLKKQNLETVRDITDAGLEQLTMMRGIGDVTVREIKRMVFGVEC